MDLICQSYKLDEIILVRFVLYCSLAWFDLKITDFRNLSRFFQTTYKCYANKSIFPCYWIFYEKCVKMEKHFIFSVYISNLIKTSTTQYYAESITEFIKSSNTQSRIIGG